MISDTSNSPVQVAQHITVITQDNRANGKHYFTTHTTHK